MENLNIAIITAAGSGIRMAKPIKKQYLQINGIPILIRSIKPFVDSPVIDSIIVSAPEDELQATRQLIEQHQLQKAIVVISGGKTRQESVYKALMSCSKNCSHVFIHDGVRPLIRQELIEQLENELKHHPAVIPVAKIKPSIKELEAGRIKKHIPRENLVQALTPQAFEYQLIFQAHHKALQEGLEATDDAALVQHYGAEVIALESSELNIKITDEADLLLASLLIQHYNKDIL